jgi:hypothetical protein
MANLGGIGVISSISCGQAFTDAFEGAVTNAIGGNQSDISYLDEVGYDSKSLEAAVRSFAADDSITLIVTFGGRIAFEAANSINDKAFISLLGEVPGSRNSKSFGGVSTESYARNQPRQVSATFAAGNPSVTAPIGATVSAADLVTFTAGSGGMLPGNVTAGTQYKISSTNLSPTAFQFTDLAGTTITPNAAGTPPIYAWVGWNNRICIIARDLGPTPKQISLLYHPGSPLAKNEIKAWTARGDFAWPTFGSFPKGPGGSVVAFRVNKGFADAFDRIDNDFVIVSADPFFQEHKEELIDAANQSGKTVCYPYNEYRNRGGVHKPRKAYIYGPNLRDIIVQMGTMAGNYVSTPGDKGFTQVVAGYGPRLKPIT